ncbi:MAG: DNA polymerase III subunit delta, partial [bacterium]
MNYYEFINHIKKRKFFNTYFLCGKEDFLLEDALKRLIAALVEPSTREFNFDVFYGNEVDGGKIIDTANAYPMLANSRTVVVKDVDKLSVTSLEALSKYIEKPTPSTQLILISDKIDFRNKVYAKIKANTCYVEFKPLYERQIPPWIRGRLEEMGFEISQEAALLIQSRVGNNLRVIVNELEKIILNLTGKKKIEVKDVQKVVGLTRKFSVFDLNDAIGYKDLEKALVILNHMLESGESPTGILAMIARHFINLNKLKGVVTQNKSKDEMSTLTGIPPFFIHTRIYLQPLPKP